MDELAPQNTQITLCAVDIETLGTELHSPVIQIGAAFAVWDTAKEVIVSDKVLPALYWQFDTDNSRLLHEQEERIKANGLSGSTLAFHFGGTTYKGFTDIVVAGVAAPVNTYASGQHVVDTLAKVIKDSGAYTIAQNNEYDLAMLKYGSGLSFYDFRKTLDIRSLQCLGLLPKRLEDKTHNALEDAIAELELVVNLLKEGKITLC